MVARETPPRTALTGGIKCQPGRPMPRKKAGRSDLQRSHHRGPRVPVIPVFRGVADSGGDNGSPFQECAAHGIVKVSTPARALKMIHIRRTLWEDHGV
jgi:hypothetical protein